LGRGTTATRFSHRYLIMKIAAVQLNSQHDIAANLGQMLDWMSTAIAQHSPDLIALPEYALCLSGDRAVACAGAQSLDASPVLQRLADFSRAHRVYVHLGSVVERAVDGRFYNTSLVFNPAGRCVSAYRKIHLFEVAADHDSLDSVVHCETAFLSPGKSVETFAVGTCIVGHSICYDLRFPSLYDKLHAQGARLMMAPSAFTYASGKKDWARLMRARAQQTGSYLVGANQCGSYDNGRFSSWGHTMIVDPQGDIVAECGDEPGMIAAALA